MQLHSCQMSPDLCCTSKLGSGPVDIMLRVAHHHCGKAGSPSRTIRFQITSVIITSIFRGYSQLVQGFLCRRNVSRFAGINNLQHPQIGISLPVSRNTPLHGNGFGTISAVLYCFSGIVNIAVCSRLSANNPDRLQALLTVLRFRLVMSAIRL